MASRDIDSLLSLKSEEARFGLVRRKEFETKGSLLHCASENTTFESIETKETECHETPEEKQLELSTLEKIKIRCSPRTYRVRWIRSKGAVLVLLWNCFIVSSFGTFSVAIDGIVGMYTSNEVLTQSINEILQALSFMLLYPIAGWLADVYFGRYKVIHTSLQLLWVGILVTAVFLCIHIIIGVDIAPLKYAILPIYVVSVLLVQVGTAGYKATAIPFGIDQMTEGSSEAQSAFIHWYQFGIYLNFRVCSVPFSCFQDSPENELLLHLLVLAISISLSFCLDLMFKQWLIIEPQSSDPFKLIYKVLHYAWKNKHPRFRSAFTYNQDSIPSRIELSKPEYGGPFTVEEVEDVKTFLQMLVITIPLSLLVEFGYSARTSIDNLAVHMPSDVSCVARDVLASNLGVILFLTLQLLYEFILYPVLHSFIPTMLVRAGIGTIFVSASLLSQLAIDLVGHLHIDESFANGSDNSSIPDSTCIFVGDSTVMSISYVWLALPGTLIAIGQFLMFNAIFEFIFAQSPYSMKGFFIGLIYGIWGVFKLILFVFQLPFLLGIVNDSQLFPTCGFIYYLIIVVIIAMVFVWYSCVAWKYKKREREPPQRHHIYAEEYYSKYLY